MKQLAYSILALSQVWLASAPAQVVSGSISGSVTDRSGSAIVGATVQLASQTMATVRTVVTDGTGSFDLNAIQAGSYKLTVEHAGFKRSERTGIELTPNETLAVGAVRLEVGDVSDSVMVTEEIGAVQTTSGERSGIITAEEIQNLTVMNRDFATLVALLPGVVDNPGTAEVQRFSGGASFNVNGARSNGNSITIDGGSTENTNGGNGNNFVSIDSIGTVRIVTAVPREWSLNPTAWSGPGNTNS